MTINDFWNLIEQCKDAQRPEVVLEELLNGLSVKELMTFNHYFEWLENYASREDIWCAAYLLNGGCSDDGFSDFRRGLIAEGRSVYEQVIKNPDSLQAQWGKGYLSNESFGWVARRVFVRKMGVCMSEAIDILMSNAYAKHFDLYIDGELHVPPEVERWDFDDEAENRKRLPGLSRLFYDGRDQALPAAGSQLAKREGV